MVNCCDLVLISTEGPYHYLLDIYWICYIITIIYARKHIQVVRHYDPNYGQQSYNGNGTTNDIIPPLQVTINDTLKYLKVSSLYILILNSPLLSIDEFHNWYEKEHIPLRLYYLTDFLSGARYRVCSLRPGQTLKDEQQTPRDHENSTSSWLALYMLTSSAVFSSSAYADLRTNRSAPTERRM